MKKPVLQVVCGQPSWRLCSDRVEAWVTRLGGHLAPVVYDRKGGKIQPYSVAPWHSEKLPADTPAILRVLRGDFFCMPFGGNNAPYRGERYPAHGETANAVWKLEGSTDRDGEHVLGMSLNTRIRKGRVIKTLRLLDGHDAVYCRHEVEGMTGPMCFGHHATLQFPLEEGSGIITTSPIRFGQVYTGRFEEPAQGGYSTLKPGATFRRLDRVPMLGGGWADLSRYPAREGFEDLVQVFAKPGPLAWTAVTFAAQRYVWFALKDPRVLASTVMWHSNGGRHYAPWNGRHRGVLGLEETTSYFHDGMAASASANSHRKRGLPTAAAMDPRQPLDVRYIMAAVGVPAGFDAVARIQLVGKQAVLTARSGKQVRTPIDPAFLHAD